MARENNNLPFYTPPKNIDRTLGGVISRATALELEKKDPDFPKRVCLGPRQTFWRTRDLIDYIESKATPISGRRSSEHVDRV